MEQQRPAALRPRQREVWSHSPASRQCSGAADSGAARGSVVAWKRDGVCDGDQDGV